MRERTQLILQAGASQRLNSRPVNNAAFCREHRAVTWAVPCMVGIVPSDGAAGVRAGRGQRVGRAIGVLPYSDFFFALHDHAALADWDVLDADDARAGLTTLIKVIGRRAHGII